MSSTTIKKAYVDSLHGQIHYRYSIPENTKDTLGYACYAPDMPGFGASFDPSPAAIEGILAKGTRWYVDLFMDIFESLGITDVGFHVIGHHSGASLATEMAAIYPKQVRSICLVGASIMSAEDRARMKEKYFAPFNKPLPNGSHLLKTWDYLRGMGVGDDLGLFQREAIDHIRAWKGRNQIYGAIWDQDKETYYKMVKCPIIVMCARDDVLWDHAENVSKHRDDVPLIEVKGANFSPDRDVEGIIRDWTPFIEKASSEN